MTELEILTHIDSVLSCMLGIVCWAIVVWLFKWAFRFFDMFFK